MSQTDAGAAEERGLTGNRDGDVISAAAVGVATRGVLWGERLGLEGDNGFCRSGDDSVPTALQTRQAFLSQQTLITLHREDPDMFDECKVQTLLLAVFGLVIVGVGIAVAASAKRIRLLCRALILALNLAGFVGCVVLLGATGQDSIANHQGLFVFLAVIMGALSLLSVSQLIEIIKQRNAKAKE